MCEYRCDLAHALVYRDLEGMVHGTLYVCMIDILSFRVDNMFGWFGGIKIYCIAHSSHAHKLNIYVSVCLHNLSHMF